MRRFTPSLALATALALPSAAPAHAQEDDRSFLTAFLEDNLSGAGRKVTITGFEGALSSQARIAKLQIADDLGTWVTLEQVVLDWSRSSLLSGAVVVNELTAQTITLDRMPVTPDDNLPSPEATPFALPDLPVSVDIGKVRADRIVVAPAVLGEAVTGHLDAALQLAGGEGKGGLTLERTDGKASRILLEGSYSNATGVLDLNISAQEEADGIAVKLLDLPGLPAVDLSIKGQGKLSDFAADVRLSSDGTERLVGPVTVKTTESGGTQFAAKLAGDLAPLFLPEYSEFLGDAVALEVVGTREASGAMALEQLRMQTRALQLNGSAKVAADGLPEGFDIKALIAGTDGRPVLLPLGGEGETWLRRGTLDLAFDAAKDSGWTGNFSLLGLETDNLRLGNGTITGTGQIGKIGDKNQLDGSFTFTTAGLMAKDAALQAALGPSLAGKMKLTFREGDGAVFVPELEVTGVDYGAEGTLQIKGLDSDLTTSGKITLTANDLSRFAALAGIDLGGSGVVELDGSFAQLSGAFDVVVTAITQGLRTGIAQADRLTANEAQLTISALRDEKGTTLRALDLAAGGLNLTGSGKVSSEGSDLTGQVSLANLGALDPQWGGGLQAEARFTGTPQDGSLTLTGQGNSLKIGQSEVDRLLAGQTDVSVEITLRDGGYLLSAAKLEGANLQASATGTPGSDLLQVTGRLRDLSLLVAGYSGPVSLSGQVTPTGSGAEMDLRLQGPAAIDLRVAGAYLGDTADLTLTGTADAAVVNAMADPLTLAGGLRADLALRGPIALSSLTGRVTLSGGRLAYPLAGFSLQRTELLADLSGGRAQLSGTAELASGGRVRLGGGLSLTPPLDAALDLTLEAITLRDPELFSTTASGALRIEGPLLGQALLSGKVFIGETELLVPSTGFASAADLEAVRHINDSAPVRATRARAGVGSTPAGGSSASSGGGPNWRLAVQIDAPNRIFLRGRGLDAELGGSVFLGGTLNAVSPTGAIELIRGRLDLLGKRLDLTEASLVMEGDLVPYVTVTATNDTDQVTSMVQIIGPVNDPVVSFSSVPELPQEEVLAWLLFGRGLDSISALQAAQLANAVATLAGRGGAGIVDRLRQGFGFDDLDVQTSEDGTASVSAGKYISRNVYTEIEVDQNGQSQINLNLDLRQGLTVKGRVSSDGDSGLGIFIERDY
ncbi:translocation/assembly module TamB domain-containing protein [Xinfangfangia sp. CPCC 101601]|uniref:Translocation/assembly module TamB domain-containing protein n=1 Tax=Pseudogemmobacter lacusdianii TaxID=3069608 RepID=A0ABU0VU10_9RHOB|nr:translocation/assembly module TamB domain-containing protein [Xinfangfangia sp. CPCC 101601]MDQ2065138.1 translocation/assembly module TamB domain-containing protein [Xinfangfangia sp. CPCC 101601]